MYTIVSDLHKTKKPLNTGLPFFKASSATQVFVERGGVKGEACSDNAGVVREVSGNFLLCVLELTG